MVGVEVGGGRVGWWGPLQRVVVPSCGGPRSSERRQPPVSLERKRLTIRAAAGARPVVAFTGVQFSALGGTGSKGVSNDKGDAIRTRNSYGKKGNGGGKGGNLWLPQG